MDKRTLADQAVEDFGNMLTVQGLRLGEQDNRCVLVFDGDLLVHIEFDCDSEKLILSVHLGELSGNDGELLLRELLGVNAYLLRAHQFSLCMQDGTEGPLLICAADVMALDNARMADIVANLLEQAERCRRHMRAHREQIVAQSVVEPPIPLGAVIG
jgi:hypothetical protein